jgi:hypothetical protein
VGLSQPGKHRVSARQKETALFAPRMAFVAGKSPFFYEKHGGERFF